MHTNMSLDAILHRVECGETDADDAAILRRHLLRAKRTEAMLVDISRLLPKGFDHANNAAI